MTILLVAHTKGGVVKTTTALNLAVQRTLSGRSVALVDSDEGLSLTKWNDKRNELGAKPELFCSQQFGNSAHRAVKTLAKHYDDVIVDAGGEGLGAPEIRLILSVADIVLTPCRTPEADTIRLHAIHALISDARILNESLEALLFPVAASTHPNARDVINFYGKVAQYREYRVLSAVLRNRVAYQNWQETGCAVVEANSPDPLAVAELQTLYDEVFHAG